MKLFKGNKSEILAAILAGIILTGCGAVGEGSSDSQLATEKNTPNDSKEIKSYVAEAGLTARQRFTKALEKLEYGEDGQALAELNAYLLEVPRSNSARNLVEQINTDSAQYFPADFFTINLASGASLSTLAKNYLGSALKFYALAKYNNISNPSRVNIGQDIKIPLTQLARTTRQKEQTKQIEVAQESVSEAAEVARALEAETAMKLAEKKQVEVIVEVPVVLEMTANSIIDELKLLSQNGDFAAAAEKVEELRTFGEVDKTIRDLALTAYVGGAKQVAESNNIKASGYYSKAGQIELINGDTFAAFKNFQLANELDEHNAQAMEDMLMLQKDIADKYHREASTAFRRQELDVAIAKWDMVLEVSPNHSSANLHRAQALELKKRLDKIKKN
jgi:tetratricopeptide (TPR) repeat protein